MTIKNTPPPSLGQNQDAGSSSERGSEHTTIQAESTQVQQRTPAQSRDATGSLYTDSYRSAVFGNASEYLNTEDRRNLRTTSTIVKEAVNPYIRSFTISNSADLESFLSGRSTLSKSHEFSLRIKVKPTPQQIRQILALPGLKALNFEGIPMDADSVQALAASLPNSPLKDLDLYGAELGDDGIKILANALPNCPSLKALRLQDNEIRYEGAQAIADTLPRSSLEEIDLGNNEGIGDNGLRAIIGALPQCHSLKTLRLPTCNVGLNALKALADALPQCRFLKILDLGNNNIDNVGAQALVACFPDSLLEELVLAANELSDDGAQTIAAGLEDFTSLKVLDLMNNGIVSAGMQAISAALPASSLKEVNLAENDLYYDDDEQAKVDQQAMVEKNPTINIIFE